MARFLSLNGKLLAAGAPLITVDNRSFRYGDGFFETIKMIDGKIALEHFHMERLFHTLEILKFQKPGYFTAEYIRQQITALAVKNNHHKGCTRIRLTIFRGEGGLYEVENHFPNCLVQSWELNPSNNQLNENGLVLDIFKAGRKACDHFSNLKSNSYLLYTMAALWAREQKCNDALILNSHNRLAEATIANVFMVKDGQIKTPSLDEGPVGGTMRRYLLQSLREKNMPVVEGTIEIEELYDASEIFLTNAIYGIRWVKQLGTHEYTSTIASKLYREIISGLF